MLSLSKILPKNESYRLVFHHFAVFHQIRFKNIAMIITIIQNTSEPLELPVLFHIMTIGATELLGLGQSISNSRQKRQVL